MKENPMGLPQTDEVEKKRYRVVCGVPINQMSRKLSTISGMATGCEMEAHKVYDDEKIDHFGYFEDFYKLWSNYEIKELRKKVTELEKGHEILNLAHSSLADEIERLRSKR